MDESDTAAILPVDRPTGTSPNEESTTYNSFTQKTNKEDDIRTHFTRRPPHACAFSVTVEPVLFLATFSLVLQRPLSTQYLWDRISEDLGYSGTKAGGCGNTSAEPDPLQKDVETLTAHWNLYIDLGGFALGLVVVTLLGSWSDQAGRRPVLILSSLGLALQAIVYLLVMYLKLPVAYFLLGRLLSGLSGDFSALLAGCFSYVADTSDRGSRTFRVAVLGSCVGLAGMLAGIIGGQWRKAQGYINPFWLVLATNLAVALYAYLFVPESVTPDPRAKLLTARHHRAIYRLYSGRGGARESLAEGGRVKLWLYTLCFFVVLTVHLGSRDLYVLYELSAPLCWGPALIGYGFAAQYLGCLSSLVGLRVLQLCLADSWVAIAGVASSMAGLVVISFAHSTQLMFTGYGLCFLFMATTAVLRSKLSKLVGPTEQGALFASVACVAELGSFVGSGLFNSIHAALYEGLPLPLCCHPPPHPGWNHWDPGVSRTKKREQKF